MPNRSKFSSKSNRAQTMPLLLTSCSKEGQPLQRMQPMSAEVPQVTNHLRELPITQKFHKDSSRMGHHHRQQIWQESLMGRHQHHALMAMSALIAIMLLLGSRVRQLSTSCQPLRRQHLQMLTRCYSQRISSLQVAMLALTRTHLPHPLHTTKTEFRLSIGPTTEAGPLSQVQTIKKIPELSQAPGSRCPQIEPQPTQMASPISSKTTCSGRPNPFIRVICLLDLKLQANSNLTTSEG